MENSVFCASRSGYHLLLRTLESLRIHHTDISLPEIVKFNFQRFPNSEFKVVGQGNLREKKVHLFVSIRQELPGYDINVSEDFLELLEMCDAIQRAGANELNIHFGYLMFQRQEKKKPKEPITSRMLFTCLEAVCESFLKRYSSVNIHEKAIQGNTKKPFDVISVLPLHILFFKRYLNDKPFIAVSNDEGFADRIREFAEKAGASGTIIMKKKRDKNEDPSTTILDGIQYIKEFEYFVIGDDEISSADSLVNTKKIIRAYNPHARISAFADHGLFNFKNDTLAEQKIFDNGIIVHTTDTIPRSKEYLDSSYKWLRTSSVATYLADLVYCISKAQSFGEKYEQHLADVLAGKVQLEDFLIHIDPKEPVLK